MYVGGARSRGVDAILQWDLLDAPNFNDQENMMLTLMEITDSILHEIHVALNTKE